MPAKARKWTLINNYGDKTLMRNALAFKISEAIGMDYTPACRLVDVIVNGEYEGTYQLCDQIEIRKNRVGITEMAPVDIAEPNLSGGYLLEVDAYADQENRISPLLLRHTACLLPLNRPMRMTLCRSSSTI